MTEQRIADLEHDGSELVPAIAPLGDDPRHCRGCAAWAEVRRRRAECDHPADQRESVSIEIWGGGLSQQRFWCGVCGTPLDDEGDTPEPE